MVVLKGFHLAMALPVSSNTFGGCNGRSCCGNVWHLVLDSCLTNIRIVVFTQFAARCIDHQLSLLVLDSINNIWSPFMHLLNKFRFYGMLRQKGLSSDGSFNLETEVIKLPGNRQHCRSVALGHCEQNRPF